MAYDYHTGQLVPDSTWSETNGAAIAVDWFGIEDLILWPMLIVDLAAFSIKVLPRVIRLGGRATLATGQLLKRGAAVARDAIAQGMSGRKWKALIRLEQELAELSNITVRLGGRGSAKISGIDALRQLFQLRLSQFKRLASHWPTDLADRYLAEIKNVMTRGARSAKISAELRAELSTGRLTKETLEHLPAKLQKEIKDLVESRWDTIRKAFWRNVYDDVDLKMELEQVGLKFKNRGNAPTLTIGGKKIGITLDHVARKVQNPLEAFNPENLRAATSLDNSALKEALVREIKDLTGLSIEDYEALSRTATSKLPKDLASGLGEALDALPSADDIFRGLGWVNPSLSVNLS